MIVAKNNQKTYGVLHTENYFSFIGFNKNASNDKVQQIDIYLDDILIDTITADKHIKELEDIYEIDGFGFEYILPNEYIGEKKIISFKNHTTQKDLQNSPYELLNINHPKYYESKFITNTFRKLNIRNFENSFKKDCVSFIGNEETIKDKEFIDYIVLIHNTFKNFQINIFYFNQEEKYLITNKFINLSIKINLIMLSDIQQIIDNTEFFIFNNNVPLNLKRIFYILRSFSTNIATFQLISDTKYLTLNALDTSKHPCILNSNVYNFTKKELQDNKYNIYSLVFKDILKKELNIVFDLQSNLYNFIYVDMINYISKSEEIKNTYIKFHKNTLEKLNLIPKLIV